MVRSFILLGSSRRSSTSCVSTEQLVNEKVKEVLQVVRRKGPPLTAKQVRNKSMKKTLINQLMYT